MNLKKFIFINTIAIFLLCFLTHFIYDFFPNNFFALLFPVNESIWEHMKMLFSTIMIYGMIEYIIYIKLRYDVHNFLFSLVIRGFLSIIIFLVFYLPIHFILGHSMVITLILLFLAIFIVEMISYFIKQRKNNIFLNRLSIFLIIVLFVIFGYLTYCPFKNFLFYDSVHNKYGINIEVK